MEDIKRSIDVIENVELKYGLDNGETEIIREVMNDFKVRIPLIGCFSAGKSALINNILGWSDVCKENIGVEATVPTEVFAGKEDRVYIYPLKTEPITMGEFYDIRDSINIQNTEFVKIQLQDNETLNLFPDVALVDMPGLDSGYEVHDKAINNYIKKGMAYILVFPADELTIPKTMEPILTDLNIYDMPICAVITKGNRLVDEEEQRKIELRQALKKYFEEKDIPIFITEVENGRVEDVVKYLVSMERQANDLKKNFYRKRLGPEFARVSNYLMENLKNAEVTILQLEEKQEKLRQDMEQLYQVNNSHLESLPKR